MPAPGRPHLLVVDVEACIREALIAVLGATYVVYAAASGPEACLLLNAHPIAGILLDVQLGAEDGLELIPRFRTRSAAPILVGEHKKVSEMGRSPALPTSITR